MKKIIILAAVTVFFFTGLAQAAPIDDALVNLKAGQWYEVPNSKLQTAQPSPWPSALGRQAAVMDAWNGGDYDAKRHQLIVTGGGHGDGGDSSLYAFSLTDLVWKVLYSTGKAADGYYFADRAKHPELNMPNTSAPYPDGSPIARHTYDGAVYSSALDKFFLFGSVTLWRTTGYAYDSTIFSYDLNSNSWTPLFWLAPMPTSSGSAVDTSDMVSAYDPTDGTIWAFAQGVNLWQYNPQSDTKLDKGKISGLGPWPGGTMSIDENNRLLVLLKKTEIWGKSLPNGLFTRRTTIGGPTQWISSPGFIYDPKLKKMVAWNGGSSLWVLNTNTAGTAADPWIWTEHPATDGTQNNVVGLQPQTNGTFNRFNYDPFYNVYMVINAYNQNIWLRRLTDSSGNLPPADTTTPTMPLNLQSSISSTNISLSWTPSSDNVAVSGYKIYRNNVQIGTSATNSYTDANVSPGTYVYKISAYDVAGNESVFSQEITASTTQTTLIQDGYATPEQISIFLPASLPNTTTASVKYRRVGDVTWTTGHPLYRIRPEYAATGMTIDSGFAWTIFDLTPATSYEIEVTVVNGSDIATQTAIMNTRSLPGSAGSPTKVIPVGSTSAQIQAILDNAVAGDVIQFADGTYVINNIQMRRSGTLAQPIYIRGQSRNGTILKDTTETILQFVGSSHVVLENITLIGSGIDSGISASSKGITFHNSTIPENVTVRNITISGTDMGVIITGEGKQVLIYDNTLLGNNRWDQDLYAYSGSGYPGTGDGIPDVDQNIFWNDDGIRITGKGNAAFNNTLSGYGDALAMADGYKSVAVHFYRNDIKMTGDDAIEGDYGTRNITFYDNRVHNAMTLVSLDPVWGGPFIATRNIGINIGRGFLKLNDINTGHFFYNNTVIVPKNKYTWGWVQFNNGANRSWGYQNNILIYKGSGNLLAIEPTGQNPIDFTHNSWYPNKAVWWTNSGGSFSNLSSALSSLVSTNPVFSGSARRHEGDNITVINPFTSNIILGADYHTQIVTLFTPILSSGTSPKNSGAVITGITDGFMGFAPDRGAIIEGRPIPVWGDRSGIPITPSLIRYNLSNFLSLLSNWLKQLSNSLSDVNNDGIINAKDLGKMMSNW